MMTLSDVLSARADNARACAQIDCGALGVLTLEALPLRELERYGRSADADRAIFYAACRDLQRTGAELLKAGKVYRPDQVTALVSDAEAAKAADAVRRLSGWTGGQDARESAERGNSVSADARADAEPKGDSLPAHRRGITIPASDSDAPIVPLPRNRLAASAAGSASPISPERKGSGADLRGGAVDDQGGRAVGDTEAAAPTAGADAVESGGRIAREGGQGDLCRDGVQKVRPEVVQENAEVRHDTVQQDLTENTKIRHSFVQEGGEEVGDGQVSREFLTEKLTKIAKPDKAQVLWSEAAQTPQNVVKMDNLDSGLRNIEPPAEEKPTGRGKKKSSHAHEGKSESGAKKGGALHETESDFTEELHENESELTVGEVQMLHEIESEFAETMHENKSDFRRGEVREMHESTSEFVETLHETESERAERVARELLEGLRRAAWVR